MSRNAMSGEFAGCLRERVTISRRDATRDALGGANGGWTPLRSAWAAIAPDREGAIVAGDAISALPRWRVTLRREGAAVMVGDRLLWGIRTLRVRTMMADPQTPDRIMLGVEEVR